MNRTFSVIGTLLLSLTWLAPSAAQTPPAQDQKLKAMLELQSRENARLRATLEKCQATGTQTADVAGAEKPAAVPTPPTGLQGAMVAHAARPDFNAAAAAAATPIVGTPPANGGGLDDTPPPRPASSTYSSGGGDKADDAQSPDSFPLVPGQTAWLDAHLQTQYAVLRRLYTASALQALSQQEASCNNSSTALYCKIRLGLYWIRNGVR